jgi:hypothetical protein
MIDSNSGVVLTLRMQGQVYRERFATVSDADQALRANARKHSISVLPDCTETGEDLGRGRLFREVVNPVSGTYEIRVSTR